MKRYKLVPLFVLIGLTIIDFSSADSKILFPGKSDADSKQASIVNKGSNNDNNEGRTKKTTNGKAEAKLTKDDCECQCTSYAFTYSGRVYGNCKTEYQGGVWCYVKDGSRSTCKDLRESTRFRGFYWAYQACTTPPRRECYKIIREQDDDDDDDDGDDSGAVDDGDNYDYNDVPIFGDEDDDRNDDDDDYYDDEYYYYEDDDDDRVNLSGMGRRTATRTEEKTKITFDSSQEPEKMVAKRRRRKRPPSVPLLVGDDDAVGVDFGSDP